jgi:hypothetical protein
VNLPVRPTNLPSKVLRLRSPDAIARGDAHVSLRDNALRLRQADTADNEKNLALFVTRCGAPLPPTAAILFGRRSMIRPSQSYGSNTDMLLRHGYICFWHASSVLLVGSDLIETSAH